MKVGLSALSSPLLYGVLLVACGDSQSPTSSSGTSGRGSTTTDSSLTAPSLQEPASGAALQDLQPELVIANATGGTGPRTYTFDLSLDSAFQQMATTETGVQEGLGGITKWRVTEPLEADTKYYWRARASTGGGGPGPYSSVSEFRIRESYLNPESGGILVFDPLTNGSSAGQVKGGRFIDGGWQPQRSSDCIRYQVRTLEQGRIEFTTTNLSTPNPIPGKRILLSMWDPTKGEYRDNPFRVHLQKLDESTVKYDDVRLRWISRGEEHNAGITFFDFEPQLVYEWRLEWGSFPGNGSQHVKVFLDGIEILSRNYSAPYHPKTHWIELGQCQREETLEQAVYSNVRIGTR